MNTPTLVTLTQQPLYLTCTLSREQRNKTLYSAPSNTLTLTHTRRSWSWMVHAHAKGFGSSSSNKNTSSMDKKGNSPKPGSTREEDDDEIPQVVFDRMIRRILVSVGLPLAMGVVSLQVLGLLKEKQVWDVPLWVPFLTTFVCFGSSVVGVAYGSLSTSWDADKEGSMLGLEEAQQNWVQMWKEDDDTN